MVEQYRDGLDEGRPQARASLGMIGNKYTVDWSTLRAGRLDRARRRPALEMRGCARSASASRSVPEGFTLHPRVAQVMANRRKMIAGELPLDWGCAETLAYAEPPRRRAFRSASPARTAAAAPSSIATRCCTTRTRDATYMPLQHIAEPQPRVQVIDSVLSEEAVMGFEYGYSTTEPELRS